MTPNFTLIQNDRNNVTFKDQYMQHSELNGSKYWLNLSCSSFLGKIMVLLKLCQD